MQHLQPNTTLQGGKYRIERVLGQGGFGNTYMAVNTVFDDYVAIKEFFMQGVNDRDAVSGSVTIGVESNTQQFNEQKEKFKKEARRLWKLKSEHIVKVHDLFEENGTAYYVMDYIEGESLAEIIKRIGAPLAEAEVNAILPQILSALKEVHQNEIWHLDLKPGNIMVDKQGNAYLIDFGASKQIRANGSMTTSTALCYTPGYAPNEQIGQMYDRFGPWTDIYALGATIYNLLTNKRPPMAIDIEEDEMDAFDFPTNISETMRKLVVWMMQPKRKKRPQSVDEVITNINIKEEVVIDPAPEVRPEQKPVPESESEETLLAGVLGSSAPKEEHINKEKESQTILVVSKKNKEVKPRINPTSNLPQRAIKVGDFIFEDGTYSDKIENDKKKVIGILFSYYGGAHGQILSTVSPDENLYINGKELKWHKASIAEWVDVIQNIGHCKVNFSSWEYRFFSDDVRDFLINHHIKEARYATRKSVSGVAYVVNLESCRLTPIDGDNITLPYIFISEF